MDDDQQFASPESETERHEIPAGRGKGYLLRGCLALIAVLVVVVIAAATLSILNRDDGGQAASEAEQAPVVSAEPLTTEAFEASSTAPAMAESEVDRADDAAGAQAQQSAEAAATETPSPTPEPTATAPPEATPEPTPTLGATATAELMTPEQAEGEDSKSFGAGRIAVVDGRSRLWTVASNGSERRLLTGPGRFFQFPSWSPAGNDIAVIGNDTDGGGVYVVADEADSDIRQLYADSVLRPIYLYWSPEGENVSFIASHDNGLALHLAPKNGREASQVVATSPSTFFWDWLPDGSQVLVHTGFTASDSDSSRLAFVPLDSAVQPDEIAQRGYFQAPVVAADGRYYSYSDEDPAGRRWLNVWDIDSDQQARLVFHQGVVAMGFSPTRAQLAYTSPERPAQSFYGPLRLLDLESGGSRLLVPETVLAFFWSPDGRYIAYLTLSAIEGPFEFEDAPVAGLPDRVFTHLLPNTPFSGKANALAKAYLRDNALLPPDQETRVGLAVSVIDIDSGDIRPLTVFEPTTVFLNQFLPFFDQYALSHRLWSPDSEALVLPMTDEADRDFIVVVPIDGSDPYTIAHGVAAFWSQQ